MTTSWILQKGGVTKGEGLFTIGVTTFSLYNCCCCSSSSSQMFYGFMRSTPCWHCWHCWHRPIATRDSYRLQNVTVEKYHWNIKETVWLVTDPACGNFTSLHNIYICRASTGVVKNRKSSTSLSLINHFYTRLQGWRLAMGGFL